MDYCPVGFETETCKANIDLLVNRLNSDRTAIPHEYNHFDFCTTTPTGELRNDYVEENLGQVLFGDRIRQSPYQIEFLKRDQECLPLCSKTYSGSDSKSVKKLEILKNGMKRSYQHHWIIDNMPITWCYLTGEDWQFCQRGFPIGCYINKDNHVRDACGLIDPQYRMEDTYYLFNHVDLVIKYRRRGKVSEGPTHSGQILSIRIEPRRIKHNGDPTKPKCEFGNEPMSISGRRLEHSENISVTYTYSYTFLEDNTVQWSSRWDYILRPTTTNSLIQWYTIGNSFIISLFLFSILGCLLRKLKQSREGQKNGLDKSTLLNNGVLGEPTLKEEYLLVILAAFVGTGVQLLITAVTTLTLGATGFLSPANPGALMTTMLVLFACFGTPAGYASARVYGRLGGGLYKKGMITLTGMLCPGIMYLFLTIANSILWWLRSSAVILHMEMITILGLWMGLSLPLTYIGGYMGFKKMTVGKSLGKNETPENKSAVAIKMGWYTRSIPAMLMGGILPFGCILVLSFFILNSIWSGQVYNSFGLLLINFILLGIMCSGCSVILCHLHMRQQNYNWQWRSFLTGGFTAVYFFLYCIHYFVTKLDIEGGASTLLYLIYSIMMAFLLFLVTGTIGFSSCFWFVNKFFIVGGV